MLLSVVFLKCIRTLHEGEQWRLSGITASIEFVDRTLDRAREYQQKTEEKTKREKEEEEILKRACARLGAPTTCVWYSASGQTSFLLFFLSHKSLVAAVFLDRREREREDKGRKKQKRSRKVRERREGSGRKRNERARDGPVEKRLWRLPLRQSARTCTQNKHHSAIHSASGFEHSSPTVRASRWTGGGGSRGVTSRGDHRTTMRWDRAVSWTVLALGCIHTRPWKGSGVRKVVARTNVLRKKKERKKEEIERATRNANTFSLRR